MHKAVYQRYKKVQEACETDAEYLELEKQLRQQEARFRSVMGCLPEDQKATITDYIGICAEIDNRALELSCFLFSDE